jgi:hypothetical protein
MALMLPRLLDGELSRDLAETWAEAIGLGALAIASNAARVSMLEAEVAELFRLSTASRALN